MQMFTEIISHFDSIYVLIFFYWVEAAIIVYTGLKILGFSATAKQVIFIGWIQGILVFLLRGLSDLFGIPLGVHTFILIFTLAFLLTKSVRLYWGIATTAALLGIMLVAVGEFIFLPIALKLANISFSEFLDNTWRHIIIGYAGDILLISIAVISRFFDMSAIRDKFFYAVRRCDYY